MTIIDELQLASGPRPQAANTIVGIGRHLNPDGELSDHYLWVDLAGVWNRFAADADPLYSAGPRAHLVHGGAIRWGADDHHYNLGGLSADGRAVLESIRSYGFVEILSWDGFLTIRVQVGWSEEAITIQRLEQAELDLKSALLNAFGLVIEFADIDPRR